MCVVKCKIQPALINLHPNEYNQELHYYPFAVKLDRCVGNCNTLNDLSNKVCVSNKTEDLNIHTTTSSILMPLSQLAGVSNFCSNLLSPFLSILSSQTILFQIIFYTFFPKFPWSTLLPFPSYFNFHNLTYLEIDVSFHDMTIPLQKAFNILNLHNNTHPITKNISGHPINQSHPTDHPDHTMLHLMQPCLICNTKFPPFTTVQQNWSNTDKSSPVVSKTNPIS